MIRYTRKEGLPSPLPLKEGIYENLIYTHHAIERFRERNPKDVILPRMVNINKNNVNEIYLEDDGTTANRVVVRITYKKDTRNNKPLVYMFLVIIPDEKVVKSLWFRDYRQKNRL